MAPQVEELLIGYEQPQHAPPGAPRWDPEALGHLVRSALPAAYQDVRVNVLPVARAEEGIELKSGLADSERVDFERLRAFVNRRVREALRASTPGA